jgi:enoyl reductase
MQLTERAKRAAVICLVLTVAASPATALADPRDGREQKTQAGQDRDRLDAEARIEITVDSPDNPGRLSTTTTTWTPPACYYAQLHTPAERQASEEEWLRYMRGSPHEEQVKQDTRQINEDRYGEDGEFPDYYLDKQGEGMFWGRVINKDHPDRAAQRACEPKVFWVDFTDPPPAEPNVVDTTTLAELAWDSIKVPEVALTLNPLGTQKVNLPTWVWLDEETFAPLTARAELTHYGLWSATTATPRSLRIEPLDGDVVTHPGDGVCEVREGRIGEPYTSDRAGQTPPCGLTFGRATADGAPMVLDATLTWEVTWTDSLGTDDTLPPGEFTSRVEIHVEEVQTIVR